jgi:hypothetical protein
VPLQSIKQAYTVPAMTEDMPQWFRQFVARNHTPLAQETNLLKASFEVRQLPVVGGAVGLAVVLTTPFPDINYTPLCTPTWNTTCFVTAIAPTGFTISFGTAAPGGGGILYVLAVR